MFFIAHLRGQGRGEHFPAEVAAQPSAFINGGLERCLPYDMNEYRRHGKLIYFTLFTIRASVTRFEAGMLDGDFLTTFIGGCRLSAVTFAPLPLGFCILFFPLRWAMIFKYVFGGLSRRPQKILAQTTQGGVFFR